MSNRSSQNTLRVPKPDSRHHRTFTILLSLVVTALSSGPATQSLYTFTAIDVPGSSHNDAQGINDRRQIVGSYIGDDLLPSVFILRRDGFSSLAITDVYTYGEAINNVGQVVVGSSAGHSYLWDDEFSSHSPARQRRQKVVRRSMESTITSRWSDPTAVQAAIAASFMMTGRLQLSTSPARSLLLRRELITAVRSSGTTE
jgi:hypothetical protein